MSDETFDSDSSDEVEPEDSYRLTESGEAHVVGGILGGQDVANLAKGLIELVRMNGTIFGPPETEEGQRRLENWLGVGPLGKDSYGPMAWLTFAKIAGLLKRFFADDAPEQWQQFVEAIEAEVLDQTDYFDKNPRAFA